MAISLFDFLIKITGDSKGLEDAVNRSEKAVDNMAQDLNKKLNTTQRAFGALTGAAGSFTKGLFSMRGAFGALLGSGGLITFVKTSLDLVDSIGKTADRLGLTVEAAQEYRFAAGLSGVKTEEWEQALIRLNTVLGEGKSVYKTTEEALVGIANRVKDTSDASKQAAIVNEYFGRSGAKLLPLFKEGAAGLDDLRRAARDAGAVFSEDFVRKTEEFNDQLEIMMTVIRKGLAEGIIDGFVDSSKDIKDVYSDPAFAQGIKDFGVAISSALKFLVDNAETITRVLSALAGVRVGAALGAPGMVAGGVAGFATPDIIDSLNDSESESHLKRIQRRIDVEQNLLKSYQKSGADKLVEQTEAKLQKLRADLEFYQKQVAKARSEDVIYGPGFAQAKIPPPTGAKDVFDYNNAAVAKEFEITAEEFAEMVAHIRKTGTEAALKAKDDLVKAQETATEELRRLDIQVLKTTGNSKKALEREANDAIKIWEDRYSKGVATEEQLARARLLILTQAAGEMKDAMFDVEEDLSAADIARENWARTLADDLGRGIFKLKEFDKVLENIIIRLLEAEASNLFYKLLNPVLTAGGGTAGKVGGIIGSILGFEKGGSPPPGRPSIVGEKRPELFIPNAAGYIDPGTGSIRGGQSIILTINAPGADQGTIERVRALAQAEIIPQAVQASLYAYRSTMRPSH